MQVWQTGIDKASGRIYCNCTPTAKYLAKYPLTATDEKIGDDTVLTLNDGWQVVKGRTPKPSSPKPVQPVVATDDTIILGIIMDDSSLKILNAPRYSKEPYGIAFRKGEETKRLRTIVDKNANLFLPSFDKP